MLTEPGEKMDNAREKRLKQRLTMPNKISNILALVIVSLLSFVAAKRSKAAKTLEQKRTFVEANDPLLELEISQSPRYRAVMRAGFTRWVLMMVFIHDAKR